MMANSSQCTGGDIIRSGGMTILSTNPVGGNVLREEGPTISSTDTVTKSQVSKKIKEFARQLKTENALRWTMINITHNTPQF